MYPRSPLVMVKARRCACGIEIPQAHLRAAAFHEWRRGSRSKYQQRTGRGHTSSSGQVPVHSLQRRRDGLRRQTSVGAPPPNGGMFTLKSALLPPGPQMQISADSMGSPSLDRCHAFYPGIHLSTFAFPLAPKGLSEYLITGYECWVL